MKIKQTILVLMATIFIMLVIPNLTYAAITKEVFDERYLFSNSDFACSEPNNICGKFYSKDGHSTSQRKSLAGIFHAMRKDGKAWVNSVAPKWPKAREGTWWATETGVDDLKLGSSDDGRDMIFRIGALCFGHRNETRKSGLAAGSWVYTFDIDENSSKEDLKAVNSDTLIFLGDDAVVKSPTSVKKVKKILDIAGVSYTFNERNDSGSALYFLVGKTNEVVETAKKTAELMNNYKTVVVYDPVDLSMILHEYKEWGIEVTAKIIGFNEYLLSLIESGSLKVKKGSVEYTLQDNYAYARELDDVNYGRKLIEKVGVVKDVLLIRKEANLAGNLIMNEYMPDVMKIVASNRLEEAKRMGCKVIVTENPAEYEILKANLKEGIRVISIEEMLLENV